MRSSYIHERRSVPIFIPKETISPPSPKSVECAVKNSLFDPDIKSPPNDWMMKLQSRIEKYYNVDITDADSGESNTCNSEKK